jgi:hypothetical protein
MDLKFCNFRKHARRYDVVEDPMTIIMIAKYEVVTQGTARYRTPRTTRELI